MKAILLIDIPCGLSLSDLYISGGLWEAGQDDGWVYEFKAEDIKPMPQKKNKNLLNKNTTMKDFNCYCFYRDGWNDCINQILGEEE